jgi:peptidoglycan hydrolase-like protein with peptidoglycan-binding domain
MVAAAKDTSSKAPVSVTSSPVQRSESTAGSDAYRSGTKRAVQGRDGFADQAAALSPAEAQAPVQRKAAQAKTVSGGPELQRVQEQLNKAGYDCGKPDGIWGPKTMGAVKKFQGDHKLTPDGVIGPLTLAALENAAGPAAGTTQAGAAPTAGAAPAAGAANANAKAGQPEGPHAGAAAAGPKTDKKGADEAPPEGQEKQAQAPVSGGRQAVAAAAMAEVGKVRAKDMSGKDEEGKPARVGWDRLAEYFNTSFGGAWKDMDLIKHRRGGQQLKHGTTTGEKEAVQDVLPSWCGIFAIWAVKTAGFGVGTWAPGKAAPNIMKRQNKVPQVGDVVVSPNHNHHAVVVWVAPDAAEKAATGKANSIEVKTVDGNSGSNPVSGGEVVDKGSSTMSKWAWGAWSPE